MIPPSPATETGVQVDKFVIVENPQLASGGDFVRRTVVIALDRPKSERELTRRLAAVAKHFGAKVIRLQDGKENRDP